MSLLNFSQTIYFQTFLYFPDFIHAMTQKIFAGFCLSCSKLEYFR